MTRDRRTYLGGHDVATILLGDQDPYNTPYGVWLVKTDPKPEPLQGKGEYWEGSISEAAYWGSQAEEGMAVAYEAKTGRHVIRPCDTIELPGSSHLAGTRDGLIKPEGFVEFKTESEYVHRDLDGQLAPSHTIQVLYYLGLDETREWCDVVVRVGGNRLEIQRIRRADHQADIDAILDFADAWWQDYVVAGVAPPVSGGDRTRDALLRRWGVPTTIERVDVDEEWRAVLEERRRTHALAKDLERQLGELDCRLAAAMNGATDAYLPGDDKPSWTWRASVTTRDQPKAIRDAHKAALAPPDGFTDEDIATAIRVLDAYRVTSETRRLDTKTPRTKKDT